MSVQLVINACHGIPTEAMQELSGLLRQSGLDGDPGNTILFYCRDDIRPGLLSQVPTRTVSLVKVARYQPEEILVILETLAARRPSDLHLFRDDDAGRELAVRLACRLGGSSLTAVQSMVRQSGGILCTKLAYSGHVEATIGLRRAPFCLSIAKGAPAPLAIQGSQPVIVDDMDCSTWPAAPWIEQFDLRETASPAGLAQAKVIVAAGRGAGTRQAVQRLAEITEHLGADFAVSKAVVMNGWAPPNRLLGISGTIAHPQLCIVAGASGAAAFLVGVNKSQVIVALNIDEQAPIHRYADVCVVGDCLAIMEELDKIIIRNSYNKINK